MSITHVFLGKCDSSIMFDSSDFFFDLEVVFEHEGEISGLVFLTTWLEFSSSKRKYKTNDIHKLNFCFSIHILLLSCVDFPSQTPLFWFSATAN